MRRGDLVTIALTGDLGKPRPGLVIQSDLFAEHPSVTVVPITTDLRGELHFRITISPTPANGLRSVSQAMIDKVQSVSRGKTGGVFGRLSSPDMRLVDRALALFLGLA